jgi:hypothetical protein
MASKSKSRPAPRRGSAQFQPQDLFFAGIGAVSLGRKRAKAFYAKAGPAARDAVAYVRDAKAEAGWYLRDASEQGIEAATEVQARVLKFVAKAQTEARKQLAPVLAKLGIQAKAKAAPKTRARKKPAPRRRKAA